MSTHLGLWSAALLSLLAGAAGAESTISSGPVVSFWVDGQDACYVRNVGARPVSVNVRITGEDGSTFTPDFQNCNDAPLDAGRTCVVLATRPVTGFSACSATTSGSAKTLRGTLETRLNLEIVAAQDLGRAGGKTLTSPAIYGGPGANVAHCAVRNVGRKPTSPALQVVDESGVGVASVGEYCNGANQAAGTGCVLEPGKIFRILAYVEPGAAYGCSATGRARSLRGSIHVGCCQIGAPSMSYRSAELR